MPISRTWKIAGATAAIVAFGAGTRAADSGIDLQDRADPVELEQVAATGGSADVGANGSPGSPESADSPAESPAESADSPNDSPGDPGWVDPSPESADSPAPAPRPAAAPAYSPDGPASAASADSPDSAASND
jgi:hypothetical protein